MSLTATSTTLQSLLSSKQANPDTIRAALQKSKLALLQSNLLILNDISSTSSTDIQTARTILEQSALLAIRIKDTAAFERYLSQLQPFWSLSSSAPPTSLRPQLTGLHLLLLLSRNEIGTFHTVLERLTASTQPEEAALISNPLVQFVTELETRLMEGSFSKIWQARNQSPVEEYKPLLDELMKTVRNEIASCGEKAYSSLPLSDAATLLFFTQMQDLMAFASQRPGWVVNPTSQSISFESTKMQTSDKRPLNNRSVIAATVGYAKELEVIV